MPGPISLPVGGVDLAVYRGASADPGRAVLCLHETGATAASWAAFAAAVAAAGADTGFGEVIRYDRRGWGGSSAPESYLRTTVPEQAQDALALIDAFDLEQVTLAGAGIGAVAAIELALRESTRIEAVIAVEPPLLALVDGATEGLSGDVQALRDAAEEAGEGGGRLAAAELLLAGQLPFLAPGSERLASREAQGGGDGAEARRRLASLIAELSAVPAWPLPFQALAESTVPLAIVVGAETPLPLRMVAQTLVAHASRARLVELESADPLTAAALASVS